MTVESHPNTVYDVVADDVEYLRHGDQALLARFHRPEGPGPFPAIVDVHGGAWLSQDRLRNEAIDTELASAGIVVMSIDFRMPPQAGYPASIADVNFATRWLKTHAASFGTDPTMVGAMGISTGGHQIMLSAMRPEDPRYSEPAIEGGARFDARLRFAVVCYGIVDPLARYQMAVARGADGNDADATLVRNHEVYFGSEAVMEEANPQLILDRKEQVDLPSLLMVQGTADTMMTPDMATRFAASYRRAGGEVTLESYEGIPHTFLHQDPAGQASRHAMVRIAEFISGFPALSGERR